MLGFEEERWGIFAKTVQVVANFGFLGVLLVQFYKNVPQPPLTSSAWPVELVLMLSGSVLVFELFLLAWWGCRKLTRSLACVFVSVGVVVALESVQLVVMANISNPQLHFVSF